MQDTLSFVSLLKGAVEIFRDHRSYRSPLHPQVIYLLRRELTNLIPPGFAKYDLNPIESILLSTVTINSDVCFDLGRQLSKIFSDSYENSILLQLQLEKSLTSGPLNQFIERDGRDRLKIKDGYRTKLLEILIPGLRDIGGAVE